MPYSGIREGSAAEAKIEKCVKRVMQQGHDKSAAIAICRASIGKDMNETEEVKEVEQDEKMEHGIDGSYHDDYLMGVMSFAELDSVERANEQASKLGKIIHTFTRLARNITNNPAIDPMERSSALRDLTEEMRMRLDADFERGNRSILLPTIDGKFDREYLEKLLKSDQIYKATKTEGGVEYQASDYADVPDMNMPSTWKLRLAENSSGNFTIAQIARAITAMQPGGFRGNRVELTQPKATVVSKISAAINKADGTNEQKENLRQRLNAVKTFTTHTGFKVLQTKEGGYRWLGWVSNKFIDREGEILTEDAHKDYVAWLDAHPKAAPELWTYHIPGTGRKNRADFWAYLNGFLLLGGKLTEQEAKAFESCDELGMSHGFYVLDKQGNLINQYRTFEATVLPYQAAANLWTKFTTKDLEIMAQKGMSQAQRELAIQLHGEDFVSALESDTNKMNTALNEAGVQSKENQIPEDAELVEEVSAEGVEIAENPEAFNADDLVKQFTEAVTKQLNPEGLQAAIKAIHDQGENNATAIANITKRLEALEKSDDEKLAKELSPVIANGIDWMGGFRASQSKETVVTADEKEKFEEAKPNESWVSEAFNLGGN